MQSFFFSPPTRTIFSSSRAYCNSYLPKLPNLSFQISNFSKMNRGRGGKRGGWSSRSNRETPHHQEQDNSSLTANYKDGPSRIGTSNQRRDILNIAKSNASRNPIVDERDGPSHHNKVISTSSATTSESTVGHNGYAPNTGFPSQPYETFCATKDPSMVGPAEVGWNMGHSRPEYSEHRRRWPQKSLPKMVDAFSVNVISPLEIEGHGVMGNNSYEWSESTLSQLEKASPRPLDTESDGVMGRNSSTWSKSEMPHPMRSSPKREYSPERSKKVTPHPECSLKEILHPGKISPKREHSHNNSGYTDYMSNSTVFDICVKKCGIPVLKLSLFDQNKEKRKESERSVNDPRPTYLRPGMVLLKNYISRDDQIEIVNKCRAFGIGEGGFYQPGYEDGGKLRLHMMCLGKDWDPQTRSYNDIQSIDDAKPPIIPDVFKKVVSEAIHASHGKMRDEGERNPDETIPQMEPDICIVNFYTESGKLGLHQDRDESPESIKKGLPVVSFSIGDSAEFLYGDDRDADNAKKVELKSGDVLIFGGKSRLIFHGVPTIIPKSAPKFLAQEANLRPGRLNLTFRKY